MKKFEAPELEVNMISVEDVITVSGEIEEPGTGTGDLPILP